MSVKMMIAKSLLESARSRARRRDLPKFLAEQAAAALAGAEDLGFSYYGNLSAWTDGLPDDALFVYFEYAGCSQDEPWRSATDAEIFSAAQAGRPIVVASCFKVKC